MKYMIVIYETPEDFASRTDPARQEAYWAAWMAYSEAVASSGIEYSGAALQGPETGTTVSTAGGARQVQDGPFADAKEQLGGFFILDLPNLDDALEWAARCPAAATAGVEVRPLWEMAS